MTVAKPVIGPESKDTFSMQSSHTLDALEVLFDDPRLVADAGLIQSATLAQHLGLRDLFDRHVDLGATAGRANVGHNAMSVIHSGLAGGDSIDDCDALRAGATRAVLGHTVLAPSTVGIFLRSFSWGHARQLNKVSGELLTRAWAVGGGPGNNAVTIDIDSSIHETYGLQKQGGAKFTHTKVRGYHPLYAMIAGTGDAWIPVVVATPDFQEKLQWCRRIEREVLRIFNTKLRSERSSLSV